VATQGRRGQIFGDAFSDKGSLAVGYLVFNARLLPAAGGGYRLDGEKYYSTGTLFSDYLTVATTTDHDSVATVVVAVDREGVRLIDDWDGFGQRRTGTTVFTDVAVSNDEVLSDTPYDAAPEAATRLLGLGGASAESRQRNLDRHWRNIRTIMLHNPVAHNARVIGQNLLHGTPVPADAYF